MFAEQEFVASDNISVNILSEPLSAKPDLTAEPSKSATISPESPASPHVPLEKICPIPKPKSPGGEKRGRKAQEAAVLTSSPYKKRLEMGKEVECSKGKKRQKTGRSKASTSKDIVLEASEKDWYCFLSEETLIENMIPCNECKKWAHERCANLNKKGNLRLFVCYVCQQ